MIQSNLKAMGMEEMKDSDMGDVGRFLNRLLGLDVKTQNMVRVCVIIHFLGQSSVSP